ncbi:MAG: glycoside hydrolase family 3 C-terminal domain-containing protein [Proteobacteria bacterium]|nr:glycoside hydrolase family 3 C-terminal domain-containing protein [Pseudomonadota bacterium]
MKRESMEQSERERRNATLSRTAAAQGMVLLKNDNALPFSPETKKIALFGNGAKITIKGGTGSGAVNQRYSVSVEEGLLHAGYDITSEKYLHRFDDLYAREMQKKENTVKELGGVFLMPDILISKEEIAAAGSAKIAVYVLSRNSGEGFDRMVEKGDYLLLDNETANLQNLAESFSKVIVILNIGGVINTTLFNEIKIDAIVLMSQAGMEGGSALADILSGKETPSGKLTDTWAKNYQDYPSSNNFRPTPDHDYAVLYEEGIYVGYRYFDTFNVTPAYEFGFGKSYTTFEIKTGRVDATARMVSAEVIISNTGHHYSGKEVVQLYISSPEGKLEKPYQQLIAYAKTDELGPGEQQTLTISFQTTEMASYDEKSAACIMEPGEYTLRVGNSSRNTHIAAVLHLERGVVAEQLSSQLKPDPTRNLKEISRIGKMPYTYADENTERACAKRIHLNPDAFETVNNASGFEDETTFTYIENGTKYVSSYTGSYPEKIEEVPPLPEGSTLKDVVNGKITLKQFVASMSIEQLTDFSRGSASSAIFAATSGVLFFEDPKSQVPGSVGVTSNRYIDGPGIPRMDMADGPAGLRLEKEFNVTDRGQVVRLKKEGNFHSQYATAWPIGTSLAQTWDVDLMEAVGRAVGEEMSEFNITLWLAPGMNIHRNPLCGRNFEYYSEDPILTGLTGAAITKGVQQWPGIGTTIKHFAANNNEDKRMKTDSIVSERTLREIYLKGFEIAVKSAQPMSIMSSYNKINGTYTANSYDLLTDIARGEWKFQGMIMSDWTTTTGRGSDSALCPHAGNDMIMPGFGEEFKKELELLNLGFDYVIPFLNLTIKKVMDLQDDARIINGVRAGKVARGDVQKSAMNLLNIIMQSNRMGQMYPELHITPYADQYDLKAYVAVQRSAIL